MTGTFRLCYVEDQWAWFTTADLTDQWGDDWDDAPYEHNAGQPYEWRPYMEQGGPDRYDLMRFAFDGPLEAPNTYLRNCGWSVEEINAGKTPWLTTDRYAGDVPVVRLFAGCGLVDFIKGVRAVGGGIWAPMEGAQPPTTNEEAP